ncbi:anthranilate synthase component I [Pseudogymnoascus sp. 24MN13]|nr:anthranilate synthase component I [Pseudogymnoascus sp. 24MN13]
MAAGEDLQPSLEVIRDVLAAPTKASQAPNLVPVYAQISSDLITPSTAYLKISARSDFVGAGPKKILKTGEGHGPSVDPLPALEEELAKYTVAHIPGLVLPPLTGGAIGYVGYDCVRYFEPKTARDMEDVLKVPESLFMFFDTIIAFDRFYGVIKVITFLHVPVDLSKLEAEYEKCQKTIAELIDVLQSSETPLPHQAPIVLDQKYTSNVGQAGYESHVTTLKKHILKGDIIQAVPSQRFARPTTLHPFNIYRHLRTVNPSPYLFYISCAEFQIDGAPPDLLVKSELGRVITHPIAGTVKRDRAEHVMLVDLARNDIYRVRDPLATRVDRLMAVEKFTHVQHLVSQVSGVLRPDKSRFDAFRSIFPAGSASGAPKVMAMELIAELEKEKRGVYAGAVGYFGYGTLDAEGNEVEGAMDTCIALRTMLVKDQVAYLQAGGGIVFDSDPYDEWVETMNKLGASMQTISSGEDLYARSQDKVAEKEALEVEKAKSSGAHIDLAL